MRAVSLLAFMVTLPVAFLSLIPSGTVGPALYDAIELVTALFPFKPALQAMTGALDPAGPSIAAALGHLAILIVAYGLLARFALRRFSRGLTNWDGRRRELGGTGSRKGGVGDVGEDEGLEACRRGRSERAGAE